MCIGGIITLRMCVLLFVGSFVRMGLKGNRAEHHHLLGSLALNVERPIAGWFWGTDR